MKRLFVAVLTVLAVTFNVPFAAADTCQRQSPPHGLFGIYTCDETGDGTADRYEVRSNGTVVAVGYVAETATPSYIAYVHTYVPDLYVGVAYDCTEDGFCYLVASLPGVALSIRHRAGSFTPLTYCLNNLCGTVP